MQILKKGNLSRKSELKEYSGGWVLWSDFKFFLGFCGMNAGDCGRRQRMLEWNVRVRTESCICVWGGDSFLLVVVGELSAAREPMRGRMTSEMGRGARAARNLYRLLCPHVEKSPFPPKSLPRHPPITAHRAPGPKGKSRHLQSPSNSSNSWHPLL